MPQVTQVWLGPRTPKTICELGPLQNKDLSHVLNVIKQFMLEYPTCLRGNSRSEDLLTVLQTAIFQWSKNVEINDILESTRATAKQMETLGIYDMRVEDLECVLFTHLKVVDLISKQLSKQNRISHTAKRENLRNEVRDNAKQREETSIRTSVKRVKKVHKGDKVSEQLMLIKEITSLRSQEPVSHATLISCTMKKLKGIKMILMFEQETTIESLLPLTENEIGKRSIEAML